MLDIKVIRKQPELVRDIIKKRNLSLNLDDFLDIDKQKLDLIIKVDELRALKNKVSKEIPSMSNDKKPEKIKEMKKLGEKLDTFELEQKEIEQKWEALYYQIPNILDKTAAIWNTEEDNKEEEQFLVPTKFNFEPKTHYEIWEVKGWIDIEKWSEVSWARFWYLKWDLVLLQFALINFVMSKLTTEWFQPMLPPVLVREKAMFGTGFFPAWEDGLYRVNPKEDNLHLVWTSEVPVTSYHGNETLDLYKPIKYVAYSSCFRREAGSAWKDTRGILRWHQFDKIEMVTFCKQDESQKMHDYMIGLEEKIWQDMKIPYRKVNVCSWDLWNPAMKKYDLEAWIPTQWKYREVTSCSNIWEYQSRRLGIKYKDKDWKKQFAHTLNGTLIAMSRCMIAIIENFQNKDWDIVIPKVLIPFMWGKKII